jgi:sialidase-1
MKKNLFLIILFQCCFYNFSFSQRSIITEEKTTPWSHFQKVEFKIDGISAWYIKPNKAALGNPWIWRAHFPNWHTDMDSILLERGFHIAYINTNNLFAHPLAMMVWDKFYDYLVNEKQLAPKVALEGVSRGGLYVYGWAKRNPGKVSCIYAEAPVCDFTSWPGGKGIGNGSPGDWKKILEIYGFAEAQALQFKDQPIDNLESLASFKVPILHVIGLQDSIVPPVENTLVLVNNYIKAGGAATVIPMTKGKSTLSGHHFQIDDVAALADFICKNSMVGVNPLPSASFIHSYGNLNNFLFQLQKEKKATVAFLGGSITNMNGWRNKTAQYLQELYPNTEFTFINAGIPSLGSVPHAFRLQNDVFDKGKIDLMFIESAVNDHGNGTTDLQQRKALEGIIRHAYKANPHINMVMMAFVDEDKITDYNSGHIPSEVKVHDDLAQYYHLPFINLAEEVAKRIANKEFTWADDFKNLHPSLFGQEIYFASIKRLFQNNLVNQTSKSLEANRLPAPLLPYNYANGKYVSVENAANKKGFQINTSWIPADSAHTRPGFAKVPMLIAGKAGSSFDFSFNGTAVGLAVVAGPDAGIIQYSIDNGKQQEMDLYTKWSKNLHLPWYVLLGDDLKKGRHSLHVFISGKHNESSKGTALRIAHFLVNK